MTDSNPDANGEDPDLLLTRPPVASGRSLEDRRGEAGRGDPAPTFGSLRRRRLWIVAVLLGAAPVLLTLAGALTSPPHAPSVPVGHLVYLEADEPSDHTALLRGLRVMGTNGASRQLLHETEPQDRDAGSREWISQPAASPDGRRLAVEKQIITLQEEQQGIDNQLWVLPLSGPPAPPRMLLDLTKNKLKQFIGLTWTADGKRVAFKNDATEYEVSANDGKLTSHPWAALAAPPTTPESVPDAGAALSARTPDGRRTAMTLTSSLNNRPHQDDIISVGGSVGQNDLGRHYTAHWGWSVFGGRRITALKWSPDGKFLAYSVSKPPLEDELFYINLATGRCFQLPVRTGRAGWDWAR